MAVLVELGCRYCGQGWIFPAGTRQGEQEVRIHEARCTAIPTDTTDTTEEN